MKVAIQHYKRELRKHLQFFVDLEEIGAPVVYVPQRVNIAFMCRELRLEGMREVLGITDADLKQIYAELGPQYEVHLTYQMLIVDKTKD